MERFLSLFLDSSLLKTSAIIGALTFSISTYFAQISIAQSGSTSLEYKTDFKTGLADIDPLQVVDFRYSPVYWQSSTGLPDDVHKTVVGSKGEHYYDFGNAGPYDWFNTRMSASLVGSNEYTPTHQELYSPRIPIVITKSNMDGLVLQQHAWARAPEFDDIDEWAPRRVDYVWLRLENRSSTAKTGQILFHVEGNKNTGWVWDNDTLVKEKNPKEQVLTVHPSYDRSVASGDSLEIYFPEQTLDPGETYEALVTIYPSKFAKPWNRDEEFNERYEEYREIALELTNTAPTHVDRASTERDRSIDYWENRTFPYNKISVPDANVQRLIDSSIRNIYQARELKNGKPLFQIGPSHYRGSWAADGPFFMEAFAYLGLWDEARTALLNQIDQDTGPSGVEFSKKAGLRLWMVWRHAQLTGDWEWLEQIWPKVERDAELIAEFRAMSYEDDTTINDGLMPEGFGDGGLGGKHHTYTNVYWTLSGLNAAVNIANQLDKPEASEWENEYEDYWKSFDEARNRDKLMDVRGNIYIPPTMRGEDPQLPQRGSWAFLHSIFPGQIYQNDDVLMRGTIDMLEGYLKQGIIFGTGWFPHGLWTYSASFYGHAQLWLGNGEKAAQALYDFGNHAGPVLTWREEQFPVGQMRGEGYVGDMPHNWASAEFIRLVRHLMILEREDELHLLQGMPKEWSQPGNETVLSGITTAFGKMSLTVSMSEDGQSAKITIDPPTRNVPERMVLHLDQFSLPVWSVKANGEYLDASDSVDIATDQPVTIHVDFKHLVEASYRHPNQ